MSMREKWKQNKASKIDKQIALIIAAKILFRDYLVILQREHT